METQALRPTPFQVTELSLQQEEAFPGPGLSQESPLGILFLVLSGILWASLGRWSLAGGGSSGALGAWHRNHGTWIRLGTGQEPTPLRTA